MIKTIGLILSSEKIDKISLDKKRAFRVQSTRTISADIELFEIVTYDDADVVDPSNHNAIVLFKPKMVIWNNKLWNIIGQNKLQLLEAFLGIKKESARKFRDEFGQN